MLLKDFQALTTKLAQNLSNQALATEILTQLNEDYSQVSSSVENMTAQIGDFETRVKGLQETNMNLFLKVANPVPDTELRKTEPLTYEGLLSEWKV